MRYSCDNCHRIKKSCSVLREFKAWRALNPGDNFRNSSEPSEVLEDEMMLVDNDLEDNAAVSICFPFS